MHPLLASTALGLIAAWPVSVLGLGLGRLVEGLTEDPRPRAAAWSLAYALPAGALAATVALTFAPTPVNEAPVAVAAPVVATAPVWTPEGELTTKLAWTLVGLSAAGLMARGLRWNRGLRRLAAIRKGAEPCQDAALVEAIRLRAARLGVTAPPVRVSADIAEPLLAGARRPVILLPKSLAESTDARRLELVCGHELAHLMRGDNWRIPAEEALAGLFWLAPPVAALHGQMLAAREAVCDQTALADAALEARRDYARVLVEALRMNAAPSAQSAFTGRDRKLVRMRLSAILQPKGGASAGRLGLALALGGVLTAATGAGSLALADQARRLAPPEAAAPAEEAAPATPAVEAVEAAPMQTEVAEASPAAEATPAAPMATIAFAPDPRPDPQPNPQPNPQPRPNPQPNPDPQPHVDARVAVEPAVAVQTQVQPTIRIILPRDKAEDLGRQIKVINPDVSTRVSTQSKASVSVNVRSAESPWEGR